MQRIEMEVTSSGVSPASGRSLSSSTVSTSGPIVVQQPMRLPTLSLPTFNGEFMEWPAFIENFKAGLAKYNIVNEADKASYLQAAIKCKEASDVVEEEAKSCSYSGMMEKLKSRYGQPRKYYQKLVQGLFVDKPIEDPICSLARFQNQV